VPLELLAASYDHISHCRAGAKCACSARAHPNTFQLDTALPLLGAKLMRTSAESELYTQHAAGV